MFCYIKSRNKNPNEKKKKLKTKIMPPKTDTNSTNQSGPAEWWSKKCNRLRPQVKKRPPNFNQ